MVLDREVITEEDILIVMEEVTDKFLIPRWNDFGLTASGEWLDSLEQLAEPGVGKIRGRDYSRYLNLGRGPNKDQSHDALKRWAYWYGLNVIKPWADAKGIVLESPIGAAYNIAVNGTSWRRQGGTKFLEVLEGDECRQYINERLRGIMAIKVQVQLSQFATQLFQ